MSTYFKSSLFLLCFFAATTVSAQRENTVFNSFRLSGIWGGSKHQIANFGDTRSYVQGGFFGLEFGKSLFLGFNNQRLENDVQWDQLNNQNFKMYWRGGTAGYSFASHRAIHPTVNVSFGGGKVRLDNAVDRIFVTQPSAGLEINVFRWLHLNLEGGYRFVTDTAIEGLTDNQLSGAFGQATLKFGWSWGRSNWQKRKKVESND